MAAAVPRFSWKRLLCGVALGTACALILAWGLSPDLASTVTLGHAYQGPESLTTRLYAYDLFFSFAAFLLGAFISYGVSRTKPYWSCCLVGVIGWIYYIFEAGGLEGMASGEHPIWNEFAPTHIAACLLAAWLITRKSNGD